MIENLFQIKSGIMINADVSVKTWKKTVCKKKDYICILATCSGK